MIFLTMVPQETRAIRHRNHSPSVFSESNVELSNFRVLTRFDEARALLFPMSPNVRCETQGRLKVEFWQVFKTNQNRHEITRIRGVPKAPNKFLSTHLFFLDFSKKYHGRNTEDTRESRIGTKRSDWSGGQLEESYRLHYECLRIPQILLIWDLKNSRNIQGVLLVTPSRGAS